MRYEELKSEKLLPLVASGDKRAFSCLMALHKNAIYSIVYRFFSNQTETDDVLKDVFLHIWHSVGTYMQTVKCSTLIYAITINLCKR